VFVELESTEEMRQRKEEEREKRKKLGCPITTFQRFTGVPSSTVRGEGERKAARLGEKKGKRRKTSLWFLTVKTFRIGKKIKIH